MKSALGQISGVLGHCLDSAWTGAWTDLVWFCGLPRSCSEAAGGATEGTPGEGEAVLDAARMVLVSNGGEREALLHAFPRDYCGEQIQGENPCQSDSVRHEFLLEFVYHSFTAAGMHLSGELASRDIMYTHIGKFLSTSHLWCGSCLVLLFHFSSHSASPAC